MVHVSITPAYSQGFIMALLVLTGFGGLMGIFSRCVVLITGYDGVKGMIGLMVWSSRGGRGL